MSLHGGFGPPAPFAHEVSVSNGEFVLERRSEPGVPHFVAASPLSFEEPKGHEHGSVRPVLTLTALGTGVALFSEEGCCAGIHLGAL